MPFLKKTLISSTAGPASLTAPNVPKPSLLKPTLTELVSAVPTYVLPTTPSEPIDDINAYHGVITGEPGIGKTTLGMQQPGVFLISFDPLAKSLRVLQEHCADWPKFVSVLTALEAAQSAGNFPYTRLIIDGVDLWYRSCQKFVCKQRGIEHPQDEKWGKAWDALAQTFIDATDRLLRFQCGTWFICHAKYKELEKRDGTTEEKLRPLMPARAEEIIVGKCNFMLNIHYRGKVRIGTIRGSEDIAAKFNIDAHGYTPDGRQITEIVMGDESPEQAWTNFLAAYNNEQTYATYEEFLQQQQQSQPSNNGGIQKGAPSTLKRPSLLKKQ